MRPLQLVLRRSEGCPAPSSVPALACRRLRSDLLCCFAKEEAVCLSLQHPFCSSGTLHSALFLFCGHLEAASELWQCGISFLPPTLGWFAQFSSWRKTSGVPATALSSFKSEIFTLSSPASSQLGSSGLLGLSPKQGPCCEDRDTTSPLQAVDTKNRGSLHSPAANLSGSQTSSQLSTVPPQGIFL